MGAYKLASAANRSPDRAVLFYATDDDVAASMADCLISAAGFAPVRAGGLDQAIRIEMFGDLHDFGGLNGKLLTIAQARVRLVGARGRSELIAATWLYNEFGFDAVDIGGLGESWRVDIGQPAFVTRHNVAELRAYVTKAKRGLDPGLTPVPDA